MKRILIFIFLTCAYISEAQQYDNDAWLWANLNLEKKINKKLSVLLRLKSRWNNNISQHDLGYTRLAVTYSPLDKIKFQLGYDYGMKMRGTGYYGNRHTYLVAAFFRHDFGRFKFIYRNRLQMRFHDLNISDDGYIPYLTDRNKFTLRYEATKRFEFYVAEEIFIPLMSPQAKGITRSRSFAGMTFNTTKHQSLNIYFAFQAQLQKNDWYNPRDKYSSSPLNHDYIYGIGYNIEF